MTWKGGASLGGTTSPSIKIPFKRRTKTKESLQKFRKIVSNKDDGISSLFVSLSTFLLAAPRKDQWVSLGRSTMQLSSIPGHLLCLVMPEYNVAKCSFSTSLKTLAVVVLFKSSNKAESLSHSPTHY